MTDTPLNDLFGEARDRPAPPPARARAALAALAASLLLAAPMPGRAHEGHDQPERPASNASAASSSPPSGPTASALRPPSTTGNTTRFAAQSDQLELVGVLAGYHWYCGRLLGQFRTGSNTKSHVWFRFFNEVPVLVLLIVLFLVVLKPF